MKVWTKVKIEQKNKDVESLIQTYMNYIFKETSFASLQAKYHIEQEDMNQIYQEVASRLAGLLILYIGKDQRRLRDIFKKYQRSQSPITTLQPEVEGYIEK